MRLDASRHDSTHSVCALAVPSLNGDVLVSARDTYRSLMMPPPGFAYLRVRASAVKSNVQALARIQARQIAHVVAQLDDFPLQAVGMQRFDDKLRHND